MQEISADRIEKMEALYQCEEQLHRELDSLSRQWESIARSGYRMILDEAGRSLIREVDRMLAKWQEFRKLEKELQR